MVAATDFRMEFKSIEILLFDIPSQTEISYWKYFFIDFTLTKGSYKSFYVLMFGVMLRYNYPFLYFLFFSFF